MLLNSPVDGNPKGGYFEESKGWVDPPPHTAWLTQSNVCLASFSRAQSHCPSLQHDLEKSFLWWQGDLLSQRHLKKSPIAGELGSLDYRGIYLVTHCDHPLQPIKALLMGAHHTDKTRPHWDRNALWDEGQHQDHYIGNYFLSILWILPLDQKN